MAVIGLVLLAGCVAPTNTTKNNSIAASTSAACPAISTAEVTIKRDFGPPTEDRSQSFKQLTERSDVAPVNGKKKAILIYMDATVSGNVDLQADGLTLNDGRTCLWMTKGSTTIIWRNTISYAAEVVPGSCADKFLHEYADRILTAQPRYEDVMEPKITAAIIEANRLAVSDTTFQGAKQKLQQEVEAAFEQTLKAKFKDYQEEMNAVSGIDFTREILARCGASQLTKGVDL